VFKTQKEKKLQQYNKDKQQQRVYKQIDITILSPNKCQFSISKDSYYRQTQYQSTFGWPLKYTLNCIDLQQLPLF